MPAGDGRDRLQPQLSEGADTSAGAASATFSPLSAHAPSWRGQQGGPAADTRGLQQGPPLLHHRGGQGVEVAAAPGLASGDSTPRHAAEVGSAQLPGGGLLREGRGTGLGPSAAEQGPGREGLVQGVGLGSRLAVSLLSAVCTLGKHAEPTWTAVPIRPPAEPCVIQWFCLAMFAAQRSSNVCLQQIEVLLT